MRFRLFRRNEEATGPPPRPKMGGLEERFSAYFPRLFAYVRSCVGGDMPAQEIAVEAFTVALKKGGGGDEDEFRTILFRTARRLCRPGLKHHASDADDLLDRREREILALVFDAGLSREQIARLFRIRTATVNSRILTGLRKLKAQTSPAAAAAYLQLA